MAYLLTTRLPAGDIAVYVDQVTAGDLGERTVHLGYLLQLRLLCRVLGDAGAPMLSAAWAMVALLAAWWGAAALVRGRVLTLAAPAFLLSMPTFWEHALFGEVYGPAAAAVLAAVALRLRGGVLAPALLVGVAATMHPGSLVWLPTVALMGTRGRARLVAIAAALPTAVALAFAGDYLLGDRGLVAGLAWPQPWRAAQRAWRAWVWAAPLSGTLPLLALLHSDGRRRVVLPLIPGITLSILTDWYTDVPGTLPALFVVALLAPAGLHALIRAVPRHRRAILAGATLLLVFQVGEATSVHDRARRRVVRENEAIEAYAGQATAIPWGSFGERARYRHLVPEHAGPEHLSLPPGEPFPPGCCPQQRAVVAAGSQLFVCPHEPSQP